MKLKEVLTSTIDINNEALNVNQINFVYNNIIEDLWKKNLFWPKPDAKKKKQ